MSNNIRRFIVDGSYDSGLSVQSEIGRLKGDKTIKTVQEKIGQLGQFKTKQAILELARVECHKQFIISQVRKPEQEVKKAMGWLQEKGYLRDCGNGYFETVKNLE